MFAQFERVIPRMACRAATCAISWPLPGQLRFLIRRQNQARVSHKRTRWQRHSIDFVRINHFDGERYLASELATRFCPMRFTYSVITGSGPALRWLHLLGILLTMRISLSMEYQLPIPGRPFCDSR